MSAEREQLPLSGYAVLKVYTTHNELRAKDPTEDAADHDGMRFGWDWRWAEERIFEVRITVAVEPSATRRQYVATNVIGRFRQLSDTPTPQIEEFVSLQAVAILLPYARQFLSNLTSNSIDGAFYLPTINVAALMHDFDTTKATATRQGSVDSSAGKKRTLKSAKKK
jgi:preprotein translocase subunit SecB